MLLLELAGGRRAVLGDALDARGRLGAAGVGGSCSLHPSRVFFRRYLFRKIIDTFFTRVEKTSSSEREEEQEDRLGGGGTRREGQRTTARTDKRQTEKYTTSPPFGNRNKQTNRRKKTPRRETKLVADFGKFLVSLLFSLFSSAVCRVQASVTHLNGRCKLGKTTRATRGGRLSAKLKNNAVIVNKKPPICFLFFFFTKCCVDPPRKCTSV